MIGRGWGDGRQGRGGRGWWISRKHCQSPRWRERETPNCLCSIHPEEEEEEEEEEESLKEEEEQEEQEQQEPLHRHRRQRPAFNSHSKPTSDLIARRRRIMRVTKGGMRGLEKEEKEEEEKIRGCSQTVIRGGRCWRCMT